MESVAFADNVGGEHFRVNHAVSRDPPQHVHGNGRLKLDATRRNYLRLLESVVLRSHHTVPLSFTTQLGDGTRAACVPISRPRGYIPGRGADGR